MLPADQALVQKYLNATLAKVAATQKNLAAAKALLHEQEQALYEATESHPEALVAPVGIPRLKSPSILDADAEAQKISDAIEKLKDCDCPNKLGGPFFPKEGT